MNYDHANKIQKYLEEQIWPHLVHRFTTLSFDDYLKRFSRLPSGKWLADMEKAKVLRPAMSFNPETFFKRYNDNCVTYNTPLTPNDGIQRVIYQFSTTCHVEVVLWVWIEHDLIHSHLNSIVCFNDENEFNDLMTELAELKIEGNTEDKSPTLGFSNPFPFQKIPTLS